MTGIVYRRITAVFYPSEYIYSYLFLFFSVSNHLFPVIYLSQTPLLYVPKTCSGGAAVSYRSQWLAAGLDKLTRATSIAEGAAIPAIQTCRQEVDGSLTVIAAWTLAAPGKEHIGSLSVPCRAIYSFRTDGTIDLSMTVHPPKLLPHLPRIGLRFAIPDTYSQVQWFGKGPHESYDDRRSSAYLGVFERSVQQLFPHYLVPQECGRRSDPR
jgi:hypothetical protein